jgi:hypothetical protein
MLSVNRKLLAAVLIALVLAVGLGLVWHFRIGADKTGETSPEPQLPADVRQGSPLGDPSAGTGEQKPPPDPEPAPMFEVVPSPLGEAGDVVEVERGVCEVQGDIFVRLFSGIPKDVPLIEFRFGRRSADNKIVPVTVSGLYVGRWVEGRLVASGKEERRGALEIRDAIGYRSMVEAPERFENVTLFRLGRSYYLRFAVKEEAGTKDYEAIVHIPEKIDCGKMYRMWVLADTPFPKIFESRKSNASKAIAGRITVKPAAGFEKIEVAYSRTIGDEHRVQPAADGTFKVEARELGGELRVAEKKPSGEGWMYIHSVSRRELKLPEDAELVVEAKDLVPFRVSVPAEVVSEELRGVAIKVHPSDYLPMSWLLLHDRDGLAIKKLAAEGTVGLRFVPGTYWFTTLTLPKGGSWQDRREEVLGKLTITKDSAGKTLEIQPLTEEDKKQLPAQDKQPTPAAAPAPAQP